MYIQHCILQQALAGDSVLFMWVTEAGGHSAWNPIERQWQKPQNLFRLQHLGTSAYPDCENPFAAFSADTPKEEVETVLKNICVAGVKDAFRILTSNTDWAVHAPSAPPEAEKKAPDWMERVKAHYFGTRDAEVEKQASILFGHVFKLGNTIYFRMCVDNFCEHCAGVVQRRRAHKPDWSPKSVLAPLGHNSYRPYLPELPADDTAPLPEDADLANLAPKPYDKLPTPFSSGRNPHKSFLQVMEQKHVQMYAKYPVNPQRRRKEQILQCSHKVNCHGTRCQYFAKCQAELDRHERFGHVVPQSAAAAPLAASASSGAAAVGEVVLPDYRLGAPIPCKKRKRSAPAGASDVPGGGSGDAEEQPDGEDSENSEEQWAHFRESQLGGAGGETDGLEAKVAAVKPPSGTKLWKVVEVPGGWLRYSETYGRCDAHCRRHGGGCKMDRSLKKGPVGLEMAWLGAPAITKADHDAMKTTLSAEAAHGNRVHARNRFLAIAGKKLGTYRDIVEHEARARGSREEPLELKV